jgi:hypothetical protein
MFDNCHSADPYLFIYLNAYAASTLTLFMSDTQNIGRNSLIKIVSIVASSYKTFSLVSLWYYGGILLFIVLFSSRLRD